MVPAVLVVLAVACGGNGGATADKVDVAADLAVGSTPTPSEVAQAATATPSPTSTSTPTPTPTPIPTLTPTPTPTPTPTGPPTEGLPSGRYVEIVEIRQNGTTYEVDFETYNFTPVIAEGEYHVHFFWDTVPPENAGTNGPDPASWVLWGSDATFTGYTQAGRPPQATRMCALVADGAHGVTLDSGNCMGLP